MIPLPDLLAVAGIVAGLAAALTLAGLLLLRLMRRHSVVFALAVAVAVTVASCLAGVAVTAAAMFISPHDRSVLFALVAISGVAGVLVAVVLGRRLVRDGAALKGAVRRASVSGSYLPPPGPMLAELADLSEAVGEAYARLQRARDRERALEESRRELVAWVSHDLRTPLAGLRAMAESLEDEVVDDPATIALYHGRIRREAERLTEMVNDLFELSRIHAGALQLSRQRVALGDLLAETLASASPLASASGVRLTGHAPPDVPIEVDAEELGRALRNIVVNAIRHTPGDATVEVTGHADGATAWVTVSDACGGIPEEDLPRLFEIAFRGATARTPDPTAGAGLGLAIARGIVEAHDGGIDVHNTGPGCRFDVRLPLAL
jgi:signal transduction histidine kinase